MTLDRLSLLEGVLQGSLMSTIVSAASLGVSGAVSSGKNQILERIGRLNKEMQGIGKEMVRVNNVNAIGRLVERTSVIELDINKMVQKIGRLSTIGSRVTLGMSILGAYALYKMPSMMRRGEYRKEKKVRIAAAVTILVGMGIISRIFS